MITCIDEMKSHSETIYLESLIEDYYLYKVSILYIYFMRCFAVSWDIIVSGNKKDDRVREDYYVVMYHQK